MSALDRYPRWARDLLQAVAVHPQVVLWGNVRDRFLVPSGDGGGDVFRGLFDVTCDVLGSRGITGVIVYDPVGGLRVLPPTPDAAGIASEVAGRELSGQATPSSRNDLLTVAEALAVGARSRCALMVDYASRLAEDPERLTESELAFFTAAHRLAHIATVVDAGDGARATYNPIIWVAEEESDLPSWLLGSDESVRTLPVAEPQLTERRRAASLLLSWLPQRWQDPDRDGAERESDEELARRFADAAHGMSLRAMFDATRLIRDRDLDPAEVEEGVRAYKVGVLDDPWRQQGLRRNVVDGERSARASIMGQDQAITSAFDILKRSVTALSGAQAGADSSRPRGVLFLAGPTGVGKTELAKHLTRAVFGAEEAYLRFDMSEFSQEHAEARLLGAPPGYVGYGAGGELTRAVREQPFRLLLFDEIEKAHGRILDNFLQILDDGRLTDGQGDTVHFTETLVVFTSNLGVVGTDEHGQRAPLVTPEDDPAEVDARIRQAIEDHFVLELGRPELLTRVGDNIVVFDFIRREHAPAIFDLQVANVSDRLHQEHGATLELVEPARDKLLEWCCADLSRGARGMSAMLESRLVNPLARWIFEHGDVTQDTVTVKDVQQGPRGVEVEVG